MTGPALISAKILALVEETAKTHCCVEGCDRSREIRQYCEMHYARLRRRGTAPVGEPFIKVAEPHKFIATIAKSDVPGCIIWPFSITRGYGHLRFKDKNYRAHKIMCEMANGAQPSPKHEAAHECGNSWCCNPRHISWKTHAENIADKKRHGTALEGERHHRSRLTEKQVLEIRAQRGKVTRKSLARIYGVGLATIDNVIDRATWTHI